MQKALIKSIRLSNTYIHSLTGQMKIEYRNETNRIVSTRCMCLVVLFAALFDSLFPSPLESVCVCVCVSARVSTDEPSSIHLNKQFSNLIIQCEITI